MKQKIRFKKGIKTIHIPLFPEFNGESEKNINKVLKMDIPKISQIEFKRTINFDNKYGYDMTEVVIYK